MKTVHGPDFYANKKHKGGAGPKDNSEDSGAGGSSPHPGDEMPFSAKTDSVSSPSIKSEVCNLFTSSYYVTYWFEYQQLEMVLQKFKNNEL